MGLIKLIMGFILGMAALRVVRVMLGSALPGRDNQTPLNGNRRAKGGKADLELVPCQYCGVYTSVPCTNPECMGRR